MCVYIYTNDLMYIIHTYTYILNIYIYIYNIYIYISATRSACFYAAARRVSARAMG